MTTSRSLITRLAVIPFDATPHVVVPMTSFDKIEEIENKVASIVADGGTNIRPALEKALALLLPQTSTMNHIIVLSDGHSPYEGLEAVAAKLKPPASRCRQLESVVLIANCSS